MLKAPRLAVVMFVGAAALWPMKAMSAPSTTDDTSSQNETVEIKPNQSLECSAFKPRQSAEQIQSFMADPQSLLNKYPQGGIGLVNSARNLAGSDLKTVQELIALSKAANEEQAVAIAAGLSSAASTCAGTAPQYGEAIAQQVAASQNQALVAAYLRADAQNAVAATAGGAGGFVGGGSTTFGETQFSGANGYRSPGDGPITVTSGQYDIGGSGRALIESVSPTR